MYEVDNRYPEVAEPYEKIRGVRRHGGVPLGSPFSVTAKRLSGSTTSSAASGPPLLR